MVKETGRLRCIYIFQFDEVRYDHLSVYGYHRRQKNIDALAKEGVAFKQAISGSSFTPVATSVLWTGMIAAHAGVRRPGDMLQAASLQEYIKMLGWTTMGCVSQHIVGSSLGMNFGFDRLVEPTDVNAQDAWGNAFEHGKHLGIRAAPRDALRAVPVGKYYVNENIDFIKTNKKGNFYLYNQYYETHTCSENYLVRSGRLKEGVMAENSYYDAKIKLADEEVIGPVIETLKEFGLYDDALIIITGDHGTNLRRENWPLGDYVYDPLDIGDLDNTHSSLYDVDLKVPLVIKYPGLPEKAKGQVIDGQVRSIDLVPTILDILDFPKDKIKDPFDGESLVPCIENLRGHGKRAYAEMLWSAYGMGARQTLREETWKYIRYLSSMYEEFFDLRKDPLEQNNLIERVKMHAPRWLQELREQVNDYLIEFAKGVKRREMPEEIKKAVLERLRLLGYTTE